MQWLRHIDLGFNPIIVTYDLEQVVLSIYASVFLSESRE